MVLHGEDVLGVWSRNRSNSSIVHQYNRALRLDWFTRCSCHGRDLFQGTYIGGESSGTRGAAFYIGGIEIIEDKN